MIDVTRNVNLESAQRAPGLGEYDEKIQDPSVITIVAKIAGKILLGLAVLAVAVTAAIFCPYSLIVSIPLTTAVFGFSGWEIYHLIKLHESAKNLAPSTSSLNYDAKLESCPQNYEWDTNIGGAAALKDPVETFKTKLEMIENAEQEILLSGSYCGREAFDIALDKIEKRMKEKPNLRVCILSATRFLTDEEDLNSNNWKKVKDLTNEYPDRFFFEATFETTQKNPYDNEFKYISNHAKLMIVDRKVMITGGSGVEDRWMKYNGLEDLDCVSDDDSPDPAGDYSNKSNGQKKAKIHEGFINSCVAKAFRDKDFILYSDEENSVIQTSVFEFYKLMTRWHHYAATREKSHKHLKEIKTQRDDEIGEWHDFYSDISSKENKINLDKLSFEADFVKPERVKLFSSGPEMKENRFEKEIVEKISEAEKSIVINHMYIHPTDNVVKAINEALKKGVDVTIISNDNKEDSPITHLAFAPRTLHNVRKISNRENFQNLHVYTWNMKNVTNHQKMIIIDNKYLFCGSSNFGYKGLDSMSDYEHNLLVESENLCRSLDSSLKEDKKSCVKVDSAELAKSSGFFEYVMANLHERFQEMIG